MFLLSFAASVIFFNYSLRLLSAIVQIPPYQLPWRLCSAEQAQSLWNIQFKARACFFKHFQILYLSICQRILIPCHSFCSRLSISPQVCKHLLHLLRTLHQNIGDLIIMLVRLRTMLVMKRTLHDVFNVQMFSALIWQPGCFCAQALKPPEKTKAGRSVGSGME